MLVAVAAWPGGARGEKPPAESVSASAEKSSAESARAPADEPLARCRRDPDAPAPLPEKARGWAVRPTKSYRRETRWIERKTKRGVKYTLQTVFAPFESALWLNRRFALVRRIEDILYLGSEERTYGVLPSVGFQSGFGATVGASVFHKSALGNQERVAAKVSYGGRFDQLAQLSLDAPQVGDGRFYLEGAVRYEGKSELPFSGIGNAPEVYPEGGDLLGPRESSAETQFSQKRLLSTVAAGAHFGGPDTRVRTGVSLVYNDRTFYDEESDDIDTVYDPSQIVGFEAGEDILELTVDLIVDTRDLAGKTGAGGLLDAFFGGAPSLDGNMYFHYGFEASYFFTLFRRGRVLMARVMLEGVEANEEAIPFTEFPRLGGVSRLRGYAQDRFRDDLATVGTLEYRYPIHHTLAGMFFVDVGKVARTYEELAGRSHWHPGFGGGVVAYTLTDVSFRLDLSYGEGFEIFFSTDALAAFRDRRREL